MQRFARRQPAVFIGSAFALGLVGARFLKSSRQQNEYEFGSESRRRLYGGGGSMSTARDRGVRSASDEGEAAIAIEDVSISDVDPLDADTSGTGDRPPDSAGREPNS